MGQSHRLAQRRRLRLREAHLKRTMGNGGPVLEGGSHRESKASRRARDLRTSTALRRPFSTSMRREATAPVRLAASRVEEERYSSICLLLNQARGRDGFDVWQVKLRYRVLASPG